MQVQIKSEAGAQAGIGSLCFRNAEIEVEVTFEDRMRQDLLTCRERESPQNGPGKTRPWPCKGREWSCPGGNHRRCMAMHGSGIHSWSNNPSCFHVARATNQTRGSATEPFGVCRVKDDQSKTNSQYDSREMVVRCGPSRATRKATPRRWRLGGEPRTNHDRIGVQATGLGAKLILSDWKDRRCNQGQVRHSVHCQVKGQTLPNVSD